MSIKILAFAAGLAVASAALAQPTQLEVNNAWAGATPGKAENGAAYVTITSPAADRLVSASTPVAKKAELHTMSMQGMVMKMRPISGVDIPAGQAVSLK
ncbi:MAG TPA: copper chaperone PCu(A)C, partial [Stellaceae bacterium]|nr:copper chaperone PCu(A)C [Stellaceae bacterium]